MLQLSDPSILWIVVLAFVIAFILAFGVGANDVANSFGTSVGSGVLSLRQACILATIFEILGSALLGYKVASTVRLGVFDINMYANQEKLLMLGYLSSLIGAALWNLLATFAKLPVSGTHSIIGAVLGFTLVIKGFNGLLWDTLVAIILSWFISPLLSGIISVFICYFIMKLIVEKPEPLEPGLKALPLFYGITIFINLLSILNDGPEFFYLDKLPWWIGLICSLLGSILTSLIVWFLVVPHQRRKIVKLISKKSSNDLVFTKSCAPPRELSSQNGRCEEMFESNRSIGSDIKSSNDSELALQPGVVIITKAYENESIKSPVSINLNDKPAKIVDNVDENVYDRPEVAALFKYLQILTACFGSFAHGANDVSNAIGPLIAVVLIWTSGDVFQRAPTPYWLMLYGGVGISVGLIVWGRRVIKTIGSDLTSITPSTGFCIELGSAATVLLATKIGLPVSTTHCKVGSVVLVGRYGGTKNKVDWSLFVNIILAWILTVPITALLSAASMYFLKWIVPDNYLAPTTYAITLGSEY
ncbi:na[+]-dependent inorganic phosphate cotransporter type III [Brevipalpus obovatus]|uniref:na[+]-dependent inorganic phosphate cotransporter type III n=1 Tax=Brevipalpus obovatus TaxID=246614 RepID=UPI003D9E0CD5